ncbi:8752_t:CDS:2, partial [Dentiscutata erythropus]
ESTWPLSEPTPLKRRFDEIFAATRLLNYEKKEFFERDGKYESDEKLKIRQDYANKIHTQDTDRKSFERLKGQLQAEQNINNQRIENLENLVREISRKFNFRAFLTAPLTATNLQRIKDILQTELDEKIMLLPNKGVL